MMTEFGRTLVFFGVVLAIIGLALMAWGRTGLPGDIVVRRGGLTLYIPLVTGLILSVVLTVVLNLLLRRR
jgi:hypothetical protein